jgi:hypothetical protein
MWRFTICLLLAVTLSAVVGAGGSARGQDQVELVDEQPQEGVPPRIPAQRQPVIDFEQMERWVFGSGNADEARAHLERRLAGEIQAIDECVELRPEQKRKLELAGRGDIKHRLDAVREKLNRFDRANVDHVQARVMLMELQPLRTEWNRNPFGEESLLAKTLANTLTPEQHSRREKTVLASSYRSRVEWVVFPLDRQLRLSREQHRRFVKVIVEETRPLKRYGELDDSAVLLQASWVPEDKLRPIFDVTQWRMLRGAFMRARAMEDTLIADGYLEPKQAGVGVEATPRIGRTGQD